MTAWTYELEIPNDADESEVAVYRETAIAMWRTASEARGAYPGEAIVTRKSVDNPGQVIDRLTGRKVDGPRWVWHVEGQVT